MKKKVDVTEEIFYVIDSQLAVLATNLDNVLFEKQFLPGLWKAIAQNIREYILQSTKEGKKVSKGTSERVNDLVTVS